MSLIETIERMSKMKELKKEKPNTKTKFVEKDNPTVKYTVLELSELLECTTNTIYNHVKDDVLEYKGFTFIRINKNTKKIGRPKTKKKETIVKNTIKKEKKERREKVYFSCSKETYDILQKYIDENCIDESRLYDRIITKWVEQNIKNKS